MASEAIEWKTSAARNILFEVVCEGNIPDNLKPKEVCQKYFENLPEFKPFGYNEFATRLRSVRLRAERKLGRSSVDVDAFDHDRKIFPAPTEDQHGEPAWAGSDAQQQLRKDIKDGLLVGEKKLKPKQLYELREVYYANYALDRFRNRIYQENKAAKRAIYIKKKSEQDAEKKKEKEKAHERKIAAAVEKKQKQDEVAAAEKKKIEDAAAAKKKRDDEKVAKAAAKTSKRVAKKS